MNITTFWDVTPCETLVNVNICQITHCHTQK